MKIETEEALIRIPIVIIGWVIMDLWGALVVFVSIINWVYTIFNAKRHKGLSKFANVYIAYMYRFVRYATFTTNERPFPWNNLGKPIEKVNMKKRG